MAATNRRTGRIPLSTGAKKQKNKDVSRQAEPLQLNRRLHIVTGAVILVGAALTVLGVIFFVTNRGEPSSGESSPGDAQAGKYPYEVGDPGPGEEAPPMELRSTEGGTFDLSSARGETVLLYFQEGLMCQPCWDQLKDVEARWGEFEELGIDRTVSITTDPLDALEQKVENEDISTPVLSDPDLAVSKAYDTNSYGMMGGTHNGHTFIVVGPDGEIQWRADYGGEPDYTMYVPVENLLADMREGLEKAPKE
jgi:peroxiredoxin